jgi:hypothetical protein
VSLRCRAHHSPASFGGADTHTASIKCVSGRRGGAEYLTLEVWDSDIDADDYLGGRQLHLSEVSLKRLLDESPWLQFTSDCQRFGPPPRLNNLPF